MKPFVCVLLALLFVSLPCTCVRAQVMDDFEDGDLDNPDWTGDRDDFVVTDGRMRLMADGAGTSTLAVQITDPADDFADTFAIEFLVDMDFSPSASNFCSITLTDGRDRPSFLDLKFGGISGDQDAWEVIGVEGGDLVFEGFEGNAGALGSDPAVIRFRATYVSGRSWEFYADYTGGRDFELEGTISSDLFFTPRQLILTCNYTATRADKFSFDDLNVTSSFAADETPPNLTGSFTNDGVNIRLFFDEILDASANDASLYSVASPGITVADVQVNSSIVDLVLNQPLPNNSTTTITAAGVKDRAGNVAGGQSTDLFYQIINPATSGNLLITEFMADPNPIVGLPEVEYIELINLSDTAVALNNVSVGSGGAPIRLSGSLAANSYAVVVASEAAQSFRDLGAEVIVANLPGLSNSADNISLIADSDTIFSINYTDDWYNDNDRDDGGYSIEYTGFSGADAGCSGLWRASLDASGGTPGRENSVIGQPADTTAPVLTFTDISPFAIVIGFSEPLSTETPDIFITRGEMEFPLGTIRTPNGGRTFALLPLDSFAAGTLYTLELPEISDCVGNVSPAREITLGIPENAEPGDVVINEILFNPASGGSDFVELYNCSDKIFQISDWTISNSQSTSSNSSEDITAARLFLPGQFLVLTEDPDDIASRYREVNPELLVDQNLPSFSDDEGNVTISFGTTILDALDYDEDFHSQLLDDQNGVSLERIRYKSASDQNNFFSAASAEGNATPTRLNSQFGEGMIDIVNGPFSLISTTVSPDGDGFEDVLEIVYALETAGGIARIRIFDAQGRLVRTLRDAELLGITGRILWDGSTDEGQRARAGAYVIYGEIIREDGPVEGQKLVAVVAGAR